MCISLSLSSQAYVEDPRVKWVRDWPGQVGICVNQIYWTTEVHEAIRGGPQGVQEYHEKLQRQLSDIVELVRGKLPKQTRVTLGALVVIDVHARDVVEELANKGEGRGGVVDMDHGGLDLCGHIYVRRLVCIHVCICTKYVS